MRVTFFSLFVVFLSNQSAIAQPAAERILPERGYLPGAMVKVTLQVEATPSETTLIETPPIGWKASNTSYSSKIENDQIKILLREYSQPRTITYLVSVPETANGEHTFSGHIEGRETTGMTDINPMTPEPVGIFENHVDIGVVEYNKTAYDSQTGEYQIEVGLCMELIHKGHFVYKKISGDCSIQTQAKAENDNPNLSFNSTANLVIFDNLTADSLYFTVEIKATGYCWPAWGKGPDILENYIVDAAGPPFFDGQMRIERNGDVMSAYYFDTEFDEWTKIAENTMHFEDPVYIGIHAACSKGQYNVTTFNDVELTYDTQTPVAYWEIF